MIGVVLLPQLLFFWLAPQDAAARWAVYIVGTVLTFLLTCMSFGVCWYAGVRRGAAMAAVSGVFDAAVISGLIGVILAELVGEIAERIVRGNEKPVHLAVRNPVRNKEK